MNGISFNAVQNELQNVNANICFIDLEYNWDSIKFTVPDQRLCGLLRTEG